MCKHVTIVSFCLNYYWPQVPETLDVIHSFFLFLLLLFETGFPCEAHAGFEISMSSGLKSDFEQSAYQVLGPQGYIITIMMLVVGEYI